MTTATVTKQTTTADIDWRATFVEALNAPGSLGNTYNRFYNYSFLNQIRLMMQGVLEPVATYKVWLGLGRQVRKGSKAKTVLAPIIITKRDENGQPKINKVSGKPEQALVGFRGSNTVFGFSDTDGDELPDPVVAAWDADKALTELGVTRTVFADIDGNKQGYSSEGDDGRQIAINPVAVYPVKTLLHELAHIVLGHCKALADGELKHRGIAEFEAEATAHLVAKELELIDWNPAESRGYIQHWLSGVNEVEDVTDKSMSRVFAAANKILVAGR